MTYTNCTSKRTGDPLKTYFTQSEAMHAADYALKTYQNSMVTYQCEDCGHWHLCPEGRHTPSQTCNSCTDRNGQSKQLYLSYDAAMKRANCIYEERGERLSVYKCCYNHGWHLAKADLR